MSIIKGGLALRFEAEAQGQALTLETHDKIGLAPTGVRPVRLYPPVNADVSASVGDAVLTSVRGVRVVSRELLVFNGGTRASTEYPLTTLIALLIRHPLKIITAHGFRAVSLHHNDFHYDVNTGEIVCSQPVFGAVLVSYESAYRLIYYKPDIQYKGAYGAQIIEIGTVFAWYEGEHASLKIPIAAGSSRTHRELYVVFSRYIADGNFGGWEMPPNWPDSNDYETVFPEGKPDLNASATRERPHEHGEYNRIGSVFTAEHVVYTLKPYAGSSTYHPKTYVRFAPAPAPGSRLEDGYKRAIESKSDILDRLDADYKRFQGET